MRNYLLINHASHVDKFVVIMTKLLAIFLSLLFFCISVESSILPYSAVITNAVNEYTLDMGGTNTIVGVFTSGTNYSYTPMWPNNVNTTWQTNPIGVVNVYVGNSSPATNLVGTQWVPYDANFSNGAFNAGSVIESQTSIRFTPIVGRYVTLSLLTNQNWSATNAYWTLISPPANLIWDCFTNQIHGSLGSYTNLDAVVAATNSLGGGLLQCSSDLSYYLSELEGRPVPIILPSQTNSYPGTIYRVVDLQNNATSYAIQSSNLLNGVLPTNITATIQGTREVDFTGWPYMDVWYGVLNFLESQGVRWVYPDEDGDYIPYNSGVSLSSLPYNLNPSVKSIYANFAIGDFYPWTRIDGPTRQGYLYWWRNHWTSTYSGSYLFSGSEIKYEAALGIINSNYTEGFGSYPHNYNIVVPTRILEMTNQVINGILVDTNWWGYFGGQLVNPTNGVYDAAGLGSYSGIVLTWSQSNTNLSTWLANKVYNCDTSSPPDVNYALTYKSFSRYYGIYPIDDSSFSTNAAEVSLNTPFKSTGDAWVGNPGLPISYSGEYCYLLTNVANKVTQLGDTNAIVSGLAYASLNSAPTNFGKLPSNLHMQVCVYGQPVLPTSSSYNASISNNWVNWSSMTTNLGSYGYDLLLTDYAQKNPLLIIPEVNGLIDRIKFLQSKGVFEAGCQGNPDQIPYNPWDYYAYPRTWWNNTLTESTVLTEFFTGYYSESSVPMLNFYNAFEQSVVTNNIALHGLSSGYSESIFPGTFTFPVLYSMQTNLTLAYTECTNWVTLSRLNTVSNQFAWILQQLNLTGTNLNNPTVFAGVGTNSIKTLQSSNFVAIATTAGNPYFGANGGYNQSDYSQQYGGQYSWTLVNQYSSIQNTLNFTNSGYYRIIVNGGYGYLGNPGLCRVTIGANSASVTFTNEGDASGYISGYTNVLYVNSGANTIQIDSFNETNNSASPGVIYTASLQYLSNSPSLSINVTNYGALGDAVQFYVNTTSNLNLVTTTNIISNSVIGDAIEVFNAGPITPFGTNSFNIYTNGYLDLVATVTNVVNGTNLYLSKVCSNTLTHTFATLGHDNESAFNTALTALYTNNTGSSILYIPTGNYLILATNQDVTYNWYGVHLSQGGFTILGDGTNLTHLIGQGARISEPVAMGSEGPGIFPSGTNSPQRGFMFDEFTPTNLVGTNTPLIFTGINIDGGIPNVATEDNFRNNSYGVGGQNQVDGFGWDVTHDAFVATFQWTTNVPNWNSTDFSVLSTNMLWQGWQGEVLKNPDGSTNANVFTYINTTFYDCRADCANAGANMIITNCTFNDVLAPIEWYGNRCTIPNYLENCLITNCFGECSIGFSASYSNIPFFYFINNDCYYTNPAGGNIFLNLNHLVNCVVSNNYFFNSGNNDIAIVTGSDSAETAFTCQSNILITSNLFVNADIAVSSFPSLTSLNPSLDISHSENIYVTGNTMQSTNIANPIETLWLTYGWTTNIFISNNNYSQFNSPGSNSVIVAPALYNYGLTCDSSLITNLVYKAIVYTYMTNGVTYTNNVVPTNSGNTILSSNYFQINYPSISTNNNYWTEISNSGGIVGTNGISTNYVSYALGSKYYLTSPNRPLVIINNDSNAIPVNSQIIIYNSGPSNDFIYENSLSGAVITLTNNTSTVFNWNSGTWTTSGGGSSGGGGGKVTISTLIVHTFISQ